MTGFSVDAEALHEVASGVRSSSKTLGGLRSALIVADVTGNAFGLVGQMVGLDSGYQEHFDESVTELAEAAAFLERAGQALDDNAAAYVATEEAHAEAFGGQR